MLQLFPGENGIRETLRFHEEKLGVGSFLWMIDTGELLWSNGFYVLLGLQPGSVEPSIDLIESMTHPEDRRPEDALEYALATGLPLDRQFRIIRKNGRVRWLKSWSAPLV